MKGFSLFSKWIDLGSPRLSLWSTIKMDSACFEKMRVGENFQIFQFLNCYYNANEVELDNALMIEPYFLSDPLFKPLSISPQLMRVDFLIHIESHVGFYEIDDLGVKRILLPFYSSFKVVAVENNTSLPVPKIILKMIG